MNKYENPTAGVCGADDGAHSTETAPTNQVQERLDRELRLKFADFMPLLPEALLNADAVRSDTDLIFDLEMVGKLVTSGCRNVPVSSLRERVPSFFRDESPPEESAVVDLPWQKIQHLLEAALEPNPEREISEAWGLTPAGARFLASFFCSRRTEVRRRRAQMPLSPGEESFLQKAGAAKAVARGQSSRPPADSTPSAGGKRPAPVAEPAGPDSELSPEKLRKQRDLARHEFARFKQDSERHLATVRAELKAVTAERNDALEALASAMGDENERITELELENVVQQQKLERALAELEAARSRLGPLEPVHDPSESSVLPEGSDQQPGHIPESAAGASRTASGKVAPAPAPAIAPDSTPRVQPRFRSWFRAMKFVFLMALLAVAGLAVVRLQPDFGKWRPSVQRMPPFGVGGADGRGDHGAQVSSTMGGKEQNDNPQLRFHVNDLLRASTNTKRDGTP